MSWDKALDGFWQSSVPLGYSGQINISNLKLWDTCSMEQPLPS